MKKKAETLPISGTTNAHLTPTVLLEGVPIVAEAAALAVLSFRVVQAPEAPPSLLVTGVWVGRVNVVVTVARPTRPSNIRGIAKEARGTVLTSGAYCSMKPSAIPLACGHKGPVHPHSCRVSQAVLLAALITQLGVPPTS